MTDRVDKGRFFLEIQSTLALWDMTSTFYVSIVRSNLESALMSREIVIHNEDATG